MKITLWNRGKKKSITHGLGDKALRKYGQDVKLKQYMNREIKFRAWDGERMKDVTSIGWIDGEVDYISTPKISAPADDFVLMQYTGLKDKNGKEIYEGDVLKGRYNGAVEWSTSSVCYGGWTDFWKESEIIGNIYENPDLIKTQND